MLNWEDVKKRYAANSWSCTKNGKRFKITKVTITAIHVDLPSGEQVVSRNMLEKALKTINEGKIIEGPADYRRLIGDERPSYAWAILHDLGFV
jgi:hypothetical protein